MPDAPKPSKPKMPIPVIRPSGTHKKPLPPGVDPSEVMRMSETAVFHPEEVQAHVHPPDPPAEWTAANAPAQDPGNGPSVEGMIQVPSEPILAGIPENFVDRGKLAALQVPESFAFEAGAIVPQLASGRISVPLEMILGQISGDVIKIGVNKKEQIKLPLGIVVPCIPPELMVIEGQTQQEMDPDFIETPFSEGRNAAAPVQEAPAPLPPAPSFSPPPAIPRPPTPTQTAVALKPPPPSIPSRPAPAPAAEEAKPSVRMEPPQAAAPAADPDQTPASIRLYLATIVKRLPEEVLAVPRENAVAQAGEQVVELPIESVLAQLASGRVSVEYGVLHPQLPPNLVVAPNAANKTLGVPLPLERIVPQIPVEWLGSGSGSAIQIPDDPSIPATLFTERKPGAPEAPLPPAGGAPTTAPGAESRPGESEPVAMPPAEQMRDPEDADFEMAPTAEEIDETVVLDRAGRLELYQLLELNGLPLEPARKLVEIREQKKNLDWDDLKAAGLRRKGLARLSGMPEPRGAVNVSVLNRLLSFKDRRTLKVQEMLDAAITGLGVEAAMMVAEDGLVLAGKPPEGFDKQMISAFIPQIFRHLARGVEPGVVGRISRITIVLDRFRVSLFSAPGIFMLFWHSAESMKREFFKRIERLTEELSRQNLSAV